MNVYLTSLMHPDTANNFDQVLKIFKLMAKSVCSQTDQNFKLFVVCNEGVEVDFQHSNIIYYSVNFPPANRSADRLSRRIDKATKLFAGLMVIAPFSPTYVHMIDADDWIASDHNAWLQSRIVHHVGYNFGVGHLVDLAAGTWLIKYGLERYCGSTFSTNYQTLIKRLGVVDLLEKRLEQKNIIEHLGQEILLDLFDSHGYREYFALFNNKYGQCQVPKVAWVQNTGDNLVGISNGIQFGIGLNKDILTHYGIHDDFSLPKLKEGPHHDTGLQVLRRCADQLGSFAGSRFSKPRKQLFQDK